MARGNSLDCLITNHLLWSWVFRFVFCRLCDVLILQFGYFINEDVFTLFWIRQPNLQFIHLLSVDVSHFICWPWMIRKFYLIEKKKNKQLIDQILKIMNNQILHWLNQIHKFQLDPHCQILIHLWRLLWMKWHSLEYWVDFSIKFNILMLQVIDFGF